MTFGLFLRGVVPAFLGFMVSAPGLPQAALQSAAQQDPAEEAWEILRTGAHVSNFDRRADAVQALGLICGAPAAVQ
jgi:hypothetical protein